MDKVQYANIDTSELLNQKAAVRSNRLGHLSLFLLRAVPLFCNKQNLGTNEAKLTNTSALAKAAIFS
jgi:hypothetical protein